MVEGESPGRHNAVDMGMMFQLLIPGVEHAEETDVGAKMLPMASDFEQGFGTGTEQQTIEELLVLQGEGRQLVREGEDQVHVARGQDFAAARLDPAVAGVSLALGAVPIATAVVGDDAMSATGALIQMTAQCGGAAALNGRQDPQVLAREPAAAALKEGRSRNADEVSHLQGWSTHLPVPKQLRVLPGC
jgi:hypothetical protein